MWRNRRSRWQIGLTVIVAVVLFAGCSSRSPGDSTLSAAPQRANPSADPPADFIPREIAPLPVAVPPPTAAFEFGSEVPEELRAEVRGAIGLMAFYFGETGAEPPAALKVVAYSDVDALIAALRKEALVVPVEYTKPESWVRRPGVTIGNTIFVNLDLGYGDTDRQYLRYEIVRILAHETAHVLHNQLEGAPRLTSQGAPRWLVEGAAEVEANTMMDALGFGSYEDQREAAADRARSMAAALEELEKGSQDLYTLGFLAVDFLTTDGDLTPLRSFFTSMSDLPWDQAFEQSFGHTVAQFQTAFEQHRFANFPPHRGEIRGAVTNAGQLGRAVYVWACTRSYGDCYWATTNAAGEFRLAVPDDRYTLQFGYESKWEDEPDDALYYTGSGLSAAEDEAATLRVYGAVLPGIDVAME